MKRIYQLLTVIVISVISFKCQKELSGNNKFPELNNSQPSPITVTLQGNVLDENGKPAAGVNISAGAKTATTNSTGYFKIPDVQLDKSASLVTAEQPGYFKAYRTFRATTGVNQVVIQLIKKTLAGSINAAAGGEITLANGGKVLLPASGIMKAAGGSYSGNVKVYAAYLDPTSDNIGKIVPGSFMADDKEKKRVVLSSYGMLAIELESSAGEKLQIASGSSAKLTMPVPSSLLSSAPSDIRLWYMDEQTGLWKEEGTAKKNGSNYVGEVKHFSYWNCDVPLPSVSFSATFKTSENELLTNIYVRIKPSGNKTSGYAHGYTDSLGEVSGLIPANENLVLEVLDQCYNVIYSKNIGPFVQNAELGTITISKSVPALVTVKGKLLSCRNSPVSDGYATIYFDHFVYSARTNDKGEFSANFTSCSASPHTCKILGIDEKAQQQGTLFTLALNSQVNDAGIINACGTSSAQFINYNLDGTDYALSNSDSLIAYTYGHVGTSLITYVQGFNLPDKKVWFDFTSNPEAGTYPLNSLRINDYSRIGLTKPFNLIITNFPQQSGDFYEGNFSGAFIDSTAMTVTHNINCSFRIKKY